MRIERANDIRSAFKSCIDVAKAKKLKKKEYTKLYKIY